MKKFKVGDKVIIDNFEGATNQFLVGKRGTVIRIDKGEFPIVLRLEDDTPDDGEGSYCMSELRFDTKLDRVL